MNEKKIIHGNIKPSNILFSVSQIETLIPKLSDFILGNTSNKFMSKSINEFFNILAPEIFEDSFFPEKNDIWSLGIIIYYKLFNKFPFEEKNEILFLNQIKSNISLKLYNNKFLDDLIRKMLILKKNKRKNWNKHLNNELLKIYYN